MSDIRDRDLQHLLDTGTVETVGDILEQGEGARDPVGRNGSLPFVLARLDNAHPVGPGIYFGMSEEDYHAAPALSASGIKYFAQSPMIYWSRTPWLNPELTADEDEEDEDEKKHFTLGHAYDTRILEGRDAFFARFAIGLDRRDYPKALATLKDIEKRLAALDLKCPRDKASAIAKLREFEPDAQLWDELVAEHAEAHAGKAFITAKQYRKIEIAAKMIEADEVTAAAISGGHPQVSIFWTCPKTGIPMKARLDYIKIRAITDMKTLANKNGRSIERAIINEIANYKYALQPSVYFAAVEAGRKMVRERGTDAIHSLDIAEVDTVRGPELSIEAQELHYQRVQWCQQWAKNLAPDEWVWIFQMTGEAPITRAVHYPRGGTTKMMIDDLITIAKRKFIEANNTYGTEPWLDLGEMIYLHDEDLPPWSTEI